MTKFEQTIILLLCSIVLGITTLVSRQDNLLSRDDAYRVCQEMQKAANTAKEIVRNDQ